jgi:hypothetical protein
MIIALLTLLDGFIRHILQHIQLALFFFFSLISNYCVITCNLCEYDYLHAGQLTLVLMLKIHLNKYEK